MLRADRRASPLTFPPAPRRNFRHRQYDNCGRPAAAIRDGARWRGCWGKKKAEELLAASVRPLPGGGATQPKVRVARGRWRSRCLGRTAGSAAGWLRVSQYLKIRRL